MTEQSSRSYEFDTDTAVEQIAPHTWRGAVSDRWSIGPYPNGGYVLAIALNAVRREVPHPDPFTVTAHYLSPPQHAPIDVEVEVIRSGRAHSTAMARMLQDGRERVRILANYGDHSQSQGPTIVQGEPPAMPPPDECPPTPVNGPMPNGLIAAIRDRIEVRPAPGTMGWADGSRSGRGELGGWARFADGRPLDTHALPLLADGLPPAVFNLSEGGWVPTLELTVHVRARPAQGWLRCWFRTRFLVDGYLEEDGELWDSEGRLVALSRQLARLNPPAG
ncbi:MAG TPA: thioesterase family protein [Candidatus Dormibacteraeota bacterium]|nr:thioesterase family protein [Candidatus Dormibacteraeota bacterium]